MDNSKNTSSSYSIMSNKFEYFLICRKILITVACGIKKILLNGWNIVMKIDMCCFTTKIVVDIEVYRTDLLKRTKNGKIWKMSTKCHVEVGMNLEMAIRDCVAMQK